MVCLRCWYRWYFSWSIIGLKEKNKNIKIALDPMGSSLYSHIKFNKLENSGTSITEGIGTGRITKNFEKALVDDAFQVQMKKL